MAIDNSITFGGVNSADYGIYIGGEGVFNAPERDVEMVSIPGRNGSFALDTGRFENIEVTYPAFNFEPDDYETFAQNLADFRNAICSLRGYQRLTDTFHPDEYRMATYIGGLEIKPIKYNTASEFNIVFNCKPQRFLTSGETAQAVADGETITNPTLFDASPLIQCKGYGQIAFGGAPIKVEAIPIGDIILAPESTVTIRNAEDETNPPVEILKATLDVSNLNTGDAITLASSYVKYNLKYSIWAGDRFTSAVVEAESGEDWDTKAVILSESTLYFITRIPAITFEKGTSATKTYYYDGRWVMTSAGGGSYVERSFRHNINIQYDGDDTIKLYTSTDGDDNTETYTEIGFLGQVNGYSTVIKDSDVYIDLDIGEAYFDDGTSANYGVSLPAELPTLAPGEDIVSFDSTFTTMEITPRWWKI